MKIIYKLAVIALPSICLLFSCEKDEAYTISNPIIESVGISPASFNFGDTVMLNVRISDAETRLTTLGITIIANNRAIATQTVPVGGNSEDIAIPVFIPLVDNMPDGVSTRISLSLKNILKGEATREIDGLTGRRPYFNRLYMITDAGEVITLTPQVSNKDIYAATNLSLHRSFKYKIAQKVNGNEIDYSGLVWGNKNGRVALIDDSGESLFAFTQGADYTQSFAFDNYAFGIELAGQSFSANDIALNAFSETTIDGEVFRTLKRRLTKNQELNLFRELASEDIVYNLDFFERLSPDKVKFLGETGDYTIYYNTYRKHVIIGVDNPSYPNYILITGGGLGYPTKVTGINKEHTWWGFDNVRNFILFRKIANDVYQGTFMIHAKDDTWVGLKPYENTSWGGEKLFEDFTFTGERIFESADGGDWHVTTNVDPNACYRITINWDANTVNVVKINL